jgi:hypothetical protein
VSYTPQDQRFGDVFGDENGHGYAAGPHTFLVQSINTLVEAIDHYNAVITARLEDPENWSRERLAELSALQVRLTKRRGKLVALRADIEACTGKTA